MNKTARLSSFQVLHLSYNLTFRHFLSDWVVFQTDIIAFFAINLCTICISAEGIFQQIPLFRLLLFHSVKIKADVLQLAHQHAPVDFHIRGSHPASTAVFTSGLRKHGFIRMHCPVLFATDCANTPQRSCGCAFGPFPCQSQKNSVIAQTHLISVSLRKSLIDLSDSR